MIDKSWKKTELEDFGGAWTAHDAPDIPLGKAIQADNCEFPVAGRGKSNVRTRRGFGTAFAANEAMSGMVSWVSDLGNLLLWHAPGTGIRKIAVTANPPSAATVISQTGGLAPAWADAGARQYVGFIGSDGKGAASAYVISYQSSAFVSDMLFPPPMTYVPSAPTEPGAGLITAGSHRLAYCVLHRGGAMGRLSPDSGAGSPTIESFTPVSFTATGSKNLRIVLNPTTWPTDAIAVYVAMTPVSNPNLYVFVPGANATVTGGGADSKTITFSINDEDLLALTGQSLGTIKADATDRRFLLTRTSDGNNTPPFKPHKIFPCGDRMGYITTESDGLGNDVGVFYASNRNAFQELTADQHRVKLPGQLEIVTGFELSGAIYLLGPRWTYVTQDTAETPVNWPTPQLVDGQKGTVAPNGVCISPNGTFAWVVARDGLYYFPGRYSALPISFNQSDIWNTINWAYAYKIQIVDNAEKLTVAVAVPLGSATSLSHILTWNYRKGFTHDRADYSPWTLSGYDLGALALVQNELYGVATANNKKMEIWVGPSDADAILRQMSAADTSPYRDGTAGVAWTYETAQLPPNAPMPVLIHPGMHYRVKGGGTLAVRALNLDSEWSQSMLDIALSSTPGKDDFRGLGIIADSKSYEFSHTAADAWCELSSLTDYYLPYARKR